MKKMKLSLIVLAIILSPSVASAQSSRQDSIWSPFRFFVGKWVGSGNVEGASGKYERSYQFIFNKKFIEARNKSTFLPTDKNPKGEIHEDLGYISYDKGRKTFVLRQFHVEGFVNQYRLDSISKDGKTIVFVTEAIENIPSGWKAKESYQLINENEFVESFELAEPNKPYEVYSKSRFKRQSDL
jgi:hypothetical protein